MASTSEKAPVPEPTARTPAGAERRERLAALLTGAAAGHHEDLHGIVVELTPLLWHVLRSSGLDAATCEDVIQTTWLTLLGQLHAIRTPQALTAWLVTVARREAMRQRTTGTREQPVASETLTAVPDDAPAVDEALLDDERQAVLWRAVEQLPPRCRGLLRIVAQVDRPDYDDVATALGMPRGSIGPTRGRCLAKLRTLLLSSPHWS
jgi:RNA polymerase sigma factor (sigma-70 family)